MTRLFPASSGKINAPSFGLAAPIAPHTRGGDKSLDDRRNKT